MLHVEPAVRSNGRIAPSRNIPGIAGGRYRMLTANVALGSAGRDEARVSGTNPRMFVANAKVSVASGIARKLGDCTSCRERQPMRLEWAKIGGIARGEAGIGSDGDGCDHAVCEQTAPAAGNVEQFRGECGMRPVERLGFT